MHTPGNTLLWYGRAIRPSLGIVISIAFVFRPDREVKALCTTLPLSSRREAKEIEALLCQEGALGLISFGRTERDTFHPEASEHDLDAETRANLVF